MNKYLILAIACMLLLPNLANARTHTIVEKSSYGTGLYISGVRSGNYVFVNNSQSKIDVLDLSDTSKISLFSSIEAPCSVYDLAIDGNILAAACNFDIHFYDVSDVANPVLVGSFNNDGAWIDYLILQNNRLYLASGSSDIVVYDTTDTNNLVELARTALTAYTRIKLYKEGDFLYTLASLNNVGIYDVSDNSSIALVSEYDDTNKQFFDAAIIDNTLYLSHFSGLQVIDIEDRSSPLFIRNVTPTPNSGTFGSSWSLLKDMDKLFLGTQQGEVVQFDLSDPHNPVDLTFYSIDSNWIVDMMWFNNNIITFSGYGGLSIADFSDTNNILPLAGYNQSMGPTAIAIEDNRVVVTNNGPLFHLMDLDDELGFTEVNRLTITASRGAAALKGDLAWLGSYTSVESYDITDFESPINIGTVETNTNSSIKVTKHEGDFLYVGTYSGDVYVYDLSTESPILVSTINLGVDPDTSRDRIIEDIKPHGNYLLIATRYDDLVVVDISDLNDPSEIGSYLWETGNVPQLEVVRNTLYLTNSNGLLLVDLTDINNPISLGSRGSYGVLRAIAVVDDKSLLMSGSNGLYYLDTSDEINPIEIHSLLGTDFLTSLAYDNGTIVAASITDHTINAFQLNSAPVSTDSVSIAVANSVFSGLLDSEDPEGDSISYSLNIDVTNGTLVINDDGSFDYTPNTDFIGSDSFQYTAQDAHGGSSTATVSITVESGYDHIFEASENTMFFGQVTETGLEGDKFRFKIIVAPTNGKIIFNKDGTFKYIAKTNFVGEDGFEYIANNGTETSENKTVKINIHSID